MPAPVGFKRSRALWDNARRARAHNNSSNLWRRWWGMITVLRPYLRAILYELQPIRYSELPDVKRILKSWQQCLAHERVFQKGWQFTASIPSWIYHNAIQPRTKREWYMVAGAIIYYVVVRWIHQALDAGPIILILTALVAIFTIGLGDDENTDGISAYSVFNRGFQRLLGEVNVEDLVAQQMGGGGMRMHRNNDDGDILEPLPPPRPRRQAAAARRPEQQEEENDDDNGNEEEAENEQNENRENNNHRRRLPGKKARRRNQEQRREIRRQREAAQAMGFGGNDVAEAQAMQRLLEEQIAENEQQG